MIDAKMPQRWDLVGEYDDHMSPFSEGDYVRVEDVEPLLAEIERLRARVAMLERTLRHYADDGYNGYNGSGDCARAALEAKP